MLRFDKMKIVVPIRLISVTDETYFVSSYHDGNLIGMKFDQKQPYQLSIKLDYNHGEAVIEFSGKILGDRYPELISRDTIDICLKCINDLDVIGFKVADVLQFGQVTKCDVTVDIEFNDITGLSSYIKTNSSTKYQGKSDRYSNGISLSNKVATDRLKKRMVIYNKQNELQKAENSQFLASLSDRDKLLSYFNGKVRFERNLTTKEGIRKALNITNNNIENVLSAETTPITDMLREVVKPPKCNEIHPSQMKDIVYEAVLSMYDYDIVKVEAAFRAAASGNTRMSRVMSPYKEYLNRRESLLTGGFDFEGLLHKLPY